MDGRKLRRSTLQNPNYQQRFAVYREKDREGLDIEKP